MINEISEPVINFLGAAESLPHICDFQGTKTTSVSWECFMLQINSVSKIFFALYEAIYFVYEKFEKHK